MISSPPIASWRRNVLGLESITITSCFADLIRSQARLIDSFGFEMNSKLVGIIPSSIPLILCSAGMALSHNVSKKCWCCSAISFTLLKINRGGGLSFSAVAEAVYHFVSLTEKFPFTLSRWRTSANFMNSLQWQMLALEISVISLLLAPLLFKEI